MKKKQGNKRHCSIAMYTFDENTGERRQLSDAEVAERLEKMLAIPIEERIKMSLHRSQEKQ